MKGNIANKTQDISLLLHSAPQVVQSTETQPTTPKKECANILRNANMDNDWEILMDEEHKQIVFLLKQRKQINVLISPSTQRARDENSNHNKFLFQWRRICPMNMPGKKVQIPRPCSRVWKQRMVSPLLPNWNRKQGLLQNVIKLMSCCLSSPKWSQKKANHGHSPPQRKL